jgi:Ca-activated chloride channel family protein
MRDEARHPSDRRRAKPPGGEYGRARPAADVLRRLPRLLGCAPRRLGLLAAVCGGALLLVLGGAPAAHGQAAPQSAAPSLPDVSEGTLLYRSPDSGRYEPLPLEHTDVALDVRGLVAAATVTQRFSNPTAAPLEAVYVFPLPHDAAVYDMEARVGERVIRAVVKEREEARRTYQAARDEGRRAALVEQERPNVFTTSLANVLPGERIDVRLRYVSPLAWEGGRVRLTFPMVVGPRYIPGNNNNSAVGGSGGAKPPRLDDADTWLGRATPVVQRRALRGLGPTHQSDVGGAPPVRPPCARPGHDVSVRVRLEGGVPLTGVSSPSHEIRNRVADDGATLVELAAEATLPNRDFVLEYRLAPPRGPRAALYVSPASAADASDGESGRTFLLAAFPPADDGAEPRPPLEMVYLVDVSGSMAGTSIEQARAALLQALERLTPQDRFHIVTYNHGHFAFRPAPLPATADNLAAARRFVSGLGAEGGTEMLPALVSILALETTPGYLRDIVLLTDGCLGNEEQIFAALKSGLHDARLFTVAIGSAPNHYLAANMAQFGRGSFTAIADGGEIETRMRRLLDQISSPVLTDLRLDWQGVAASDVLPARLPDLFRGQPLLIHGRLTGEGPGTLVVEGLSGAAPFRQEIAVEVGRARFHPGVTTLWARAKVDELMDLWRAAPEGPEREARRGDVLALAIRHHLVTRFTSLVAVEDVPAHDQGAPRTVAVPAELPAGWQMDKVFGGNPQGGTADLFLETLGLALLGAGALLLGLRRCARSAA